MRSNLSILHRRKMCLNAVIQTKTSLISAIDRILCINFLMLLRRITFRSKSKMCALS
jgi:hypothetical protein